MKDIRITISGHDTNGYVSQNVFYLRATEGSHSTPVVLRAAMEFVNTKIMSELLDCMCFTHYIDDIAAKYVRPDSSYTLHKAINRPGTRELNEVSGAIGGVIQWIPTTGPETGRTYVPGVCEGDYANDFIDGSYLALLETLRDAFLTLTGTGSTIPFVFVVYNRGITPTEDPIVDGVIANRAGVLSKRTRA
jgi:hypothetical protein